MAADPYGGFELFMMAGIETLFLSLIVLAASVLMREVQSFRARKIREDQRGTYRRRLDLLAGLAILTSPIAIWAGGEARVEGIGYFFVVPCLVPLLAVALVRTEKLHSNLGFQRLAVIGLIHGALWVPILFEVFASRHRGVVEGIGGGALGRVALAASLISLATWAAVNIAGWVWEGFTEKDR